MGVLPRVVGRHVHAREETPVPPHQRKYSFLSSHVGVSSLAFTSADGARERLAWTASFRSDQIDKQLVNAKVLMR